MKRYFPILLLFFTMAAVSAGAGEKKALLFMLDGTRADALFSASTPNIDSVRFGTWAEGYKGAYSFRAYTNLDAPPSSATNHVAILTGVTATKNGCYQNGQTSAAKYDEYPTVSKLLQTEIPNFKSAWLYMWGEDGEIQTEATYIGPPQKDAPNVEDAIALLNGSFPSKEGEHGSKWTEGDDIDLLMVYSDEIDANGHRHGFTVTCPEYMNYIEEVDRMIGRILETIKQRPNFADEDWLLVFNADHGGIGRTHGVVGSQNCYTVPLIVSAKGISEGLMKGDPRNCDAAAYIMKHFTGKIPEYFDAKIDDASPIEKRALTDSLIAYFPFEENVAPAVGDFAGDDGFIPREYPADGRIGFALSMKDSNPVYFGRPDALQFGKERDFTFAFWFRTDQIQIGSSPFLGNKDVDDREQPGIVFRSNTISDHGNGMGLMVNDAVSRHVISPLEYLPDNQWNFAAITYDRGGDAILYLGFPDGKLAFVAERMGESEDMNSLDWYLGQDGSGVNENHFTGDLDELMIWDRVLDCEEVYELFQKGIRGEPINQ